MSSNNNKIVYQTDGTNDLVSLMGQTYGLDVAKNLIKFENKNDLYQSIQITNITENLLQNKLIKNGDYVSDAESEKAMVELAERWNKRTTNVKTMSYQIIPGEGVLN